MKNEQQNSLLNTALSPVEEKIWNLLDEVMDPEVPVLSVTDLGIIRRVYNIGSDENDNWCIDITPTYSGCPALDAITTSIRLKMIEHGFRNVSIRQVLSPAWTTDWMSEEGRKKLKEFGIAPPNPRQQVCEPGPFHQEEAVQCPQCNSYRTLLLSQFGSTACKALYRCSECSETFDYFKCH